MHCVPCVCVPRTCTYLQLHVVRRDGSNQLLTTFEAQPSYPELEASLKAWPEAAVNKSLVDRLRDEVRVWWRQCTSLGACRQSAVAVTWKGAGICAGGKLQL